jgi:hypothetical protein
MINLIHEHLKKDLMNSKEVENQNHRINLRFGFSKSYTVNKYKFKE